jgi:Uma2 family endonuclease
MTLPDAPAIPQIPSAESAAAVRGPSVAAAKRRRRGLGSTRLTLRGVRWATYIAMVTDPGFFRKRLAYDRGTLEIMSPSPLHDSVAHIISRLLSVMTMELRIPIAGYKSTTFRRVRRKKGVEPDECWYVANEAGMRMRSRIDLGRDPPPDLVLEVDITSSSVDREGIYASFGVPEMWRYDGEDGTLKAYRLRPDRKRYEPSERSLSFPFLPLDVLVGFLRLAKTEGETEACIAFAEWVRANLSQHRRGKP